MSFAILNGRAVESCDNVRPPFGDPHSSLGSVRAPKETRGPTRCNYMRTFNTELRTGMNPTQEITDAGHEARKPGAFMR